jgi:hypothetical protein
MNGHEDDADLIDEDDMLEVQTLEEGAKGQG